MFKFLNIMKKIISLFSFLFVTITSNGQVWPICDSANNGCTYGMLTGFNQWRSYGANWQGEEQIHSGLDLCGDLNVDGEKVLAPFGGSIEITSGDNTGMPDFAEIKITNSALNKQIRIGHIVPYWALDPTQDVIPGQYIGNIGSGFWSTKHSHVHLEYYENSSPADEQAIDPLPYFLSATPAIVPSSEIPPAIFHDFDGDGKDFWLKGVAGPGANFEFQNEPLFGGVSIIGETGRELNDLIQAPTKVYYTVADLLNFKLVIPKRFLFDNQNVIDLHNKDVVEHEFGPHHVTDPQNSCVHASCISPVTWNFNYILTNANSGGQPVKRYWGTHASNEVAHLDGYMGSPADETQIAKCPSEAKFNDGKYKIGAATYGYNQNNNHSIEVTVDNFLPFIEKVEVLLNEKPIYKREWTCNGDEICPSLDGGGPVKTDDIPGNLKFIVHTSEPLQYLNLDLSPFSFSNNIPLAPSANKMEWVYDWPAQFNLNELLLLTDTDPNKRLKFSGIDFANNQLLDLDELSGYNEAPVTQPVGCVKIPRKTGPNTWTPAIPYSCGPGPSAVCYDEVHKIGELCLENFKGEDPAEKSGDCAVIFPEFSYEPNYEGCTILFKDESTPENAITSWKWAFGDGGISFEQHPEHYYYYDGTYTVRLEISDGSETAEYNETIEVIGCDVTSSSGDLQVSIDGSSSFYLGHINDYFSTVYGGTQPYNYTWELLDANGLTSSCGEIFTPYNDFTGIEFDPPQCVPGGNYLLQLTVIDAWGNEGTAELPVMNALEAGDCEIKVSGNPEPNNEIWARIKGDIFGPDIYDIYPLWSWNFNSEPPTGMSEAPFIFTNALHKMVLEDGYPIPYEYTIEATGCTYEDNPNCITCTHTINIGNWTEPDPSDCFFIHPSGCIYGYVWRGA